MKQRADRLVGGRRCVQSIGPANRAFTMAELIVVVAILAILAAIVTPVIVGTKQRAYHAACISNLGQLHKAITLYRMEEGRESNIGSQMDMGLPSDLRPILERTRLECRGIDPRQCSGPAYYEHMWPPLPGSPFYDQGRTDAFAEFMVKHGEATVMIADPNHQFACPTSKLSKQRVLGVNFGGSAFTRIKRGRYSQLDWWVD